jgi:hypothetical protein
VIGGEPTPGETAEYELVLDVRPGAATLIDLDGETLIAGLRRRGRHRRLAAPARAATSA